MLTTLLLTFAPQALVAHPHIEVRGPDGYEFASYVKSSETQLILPTLTTNERVARLVPGRGGLAVRIASPREVALNIAQMSLYAVEHAGDEHVLLVDGELMAFSTPRLPAFVRETRDGISRLPELARYDLRRVRDGELTISTDKLEGEVLVVPGTSFPGTVARGDQSRSLGESPLTAVIFTDDGELMLRDGARIDQLYYARPRVLDLAKLLPCPANRAWSYRGAQQRWTRSQGLGPQQPEAVTKGLRRIELEAPQAPLLLDVEAVLELRFELPPAPPEDRVHTYILQLESGLSRTSQSVQIQGVSGPQAPYFVDRFADLPYAPPHFEGPHDQRDIRPTMGPGAAWGDVDGDGWQDLLLVQGGGREGCEVSPSLLYRNIDGSLQRHSTIAEGAGMGALFFDLEGDGDLDLYMANYGPDRLLTNDGTGEFTDVSEAHGIGGDLWSAGVCAGDTDGDGDLELYVTSYLNYDTALMPPVEKLPGFRREDPIEMLPFAFPGERNVFYDNQDGKLVDVTEAKGLADTQGRGMQAVFWDFDRDGDLDLYIANDVSFNVLLRNDGAGNFEDISFQTGMDDPRGGMGVALGDVEGDGDDDLFLTNWQLEANALYLNQHVRSSARKAHLGTFQDGTVRSKLGPAGVGVTSWGAVLFDVDNDGDLDLFIPNGYTSPDYESTGICVGQPNQLFLNDGEGRFRDVSAEAGDAVTASLASRSAAVCDYDRDGRLDLLVTNNNGPYQLLHNEVPEPGHWLGVRLRGSGKNPFAIGARVELEAGELSLTRTLTAGEGYLACHAAELHFGLGESTQIERLTVHWPSGKTTEHEMRAVDRWIELAE